MRVRTLVLMLPGKNKTPPIMNASETPIKGMVAVPTESAKYIMIVPPAETVTVDMKVMTKDWQEVALDIQVGSAAAVTMYPEMDPVAPLP